MKKTALYPILGLALLSIIFGTVCVTFQYMLRSGANDPQIQLAEDASALSEAGTNPANLVRDSVDLNKSLAPFTIIYDAQGKVVASNAYLDGSTPEVPVGVLTAAGTKRHNQVTWQPKTGLRFATVVVASAKGYVLSGRSLREVEKRISQTEMFIFLSWLSSVVMTLLSYLFLAGRFRKR